jgi:hypothetical protein
MSKNRCHAEDIFHRSRKADVMLAQGSAILRVHKQLDGTEKHHCRLWAVIRYHAAGLGSDSAPSRPKAMPAIT